MKHKTTIVLYGILFLLVLIGTGIPFLKTHAGHATASDAAPLENAVSSGSPSDPYDKLVLTVEGTTPAMLSPSYWIREKGSEVLFTEEEIAAFNRSNPPYVEYESTAENRSRKLFMYDLPETIPEDAVRALIDPSLVRQFAAAKRPVYVNGVLPDEDYWDAIESNLALDWIPDAVSPRYAICVRRTVARTLPSEDFAADVPGETVFDRFVSAEVMPFTGVAILHESADGEWVYLLNASFCGWVRSDTVAVCRDREEWLSACMPESFLLVTGSEIVLDETLLPAASSGMLLPMGTKLRLCSEPAAQVNGRSSFGCYCVELPCREPDGSLGWEQALVPVSKDVHVGFLSMTSASVLEQAFKFLGRVYGYGGSLSSNDCSGYVRQVYGCYGFELPRNARAIAVTADLGSQKCVKMTPEKKQSLLAEMPPGLLLFMEDHIMFFLGLENGVPYVLSSCASSIEPGHEVTDIIQTNCVFVSSMEMRRANGKTWFDDLQFILWKEY